MIKIANVHINKRHIVDTFCMKVLKEYGIKYSIKEKGFSVILFVEDSVNTEQIIDAYEIFCGQINPVTPIEGEYVSLGFEKEYYNKPAYFTIFGILFFILVYGLQIVIGKPFMDVLFYHKDYGLSFLTEPWRYITPAFMHGSPFHLFMNLLCFYQLGKVFEKAYGPIQLAKIILITAFISNFAQFAISGPSFLGISGGIFGLIAYIWMKPYVDQNSKVGLKDSVMYLSIIWIILGYMDVIPGISFANEAHLFGLLSGMWLAKYEMKNKSRV